MDDRQAEFLKRMRFFIHDHIVGGFAPIVSEARRARMGRWGTARTTGYQVPDIAPIVGQDVPDVPYARATFAERGLDVAPGGYGRELYGQEARHAGGRTLSVAAVIDQLQDRLGEVGAPPWESGAGGALRGARMFGPTEPRPGGPLYRGMRGAVGHRKPIYEQEQIFSHDDQELLIDLAHIMRSVAGTAKTYLAALLDASLRPQGTKFENDEWQRLKAALTWMQVCETAFRAVPAQFELIRERRATGRRPLVLSEHEERAMEKEMAHYGLPDTMKDLASVFVATDDDDAIEKEIDDGDVFNDFAAALGGLRQAWFKIAFAMATGPEEYMPPVEEMEAAFNNEGLPLVYIGEAHDIDPRTGKPTPTKAEIKKAYRQQFGEEPGEEWLREYEKAQRFEKKLGEFETRQRATPNPSSFGWPRVAC